MLFLISLFMLSHKTEATKRRSSPGNIAWNFASLGFVLLHLKFSLFYFFIFFKVLYSFASSFYVTYFFLWVCRGPFTNLYDIYYRWENCFVEKLKEKVVEKLWQMEFSWLIWWHCFFFVPCKGAFNYWLIKDDPYGNQSKVSICWDQIIVKYKCISKVFFVPHQKMNRTKVLFHIWKWIGPLKIYNV